MKLSNVGYGEVMSDHYIIWRNRVPGDSSSPMDVRYVRVFSIPGTLKQIQVQDLRTSLYLSSGHLGEQDDVFKGLYRHPPYKPFLKFSSVETVHYHKTIVEWQGMLLSNVPEKLAEMVMERDRLQKRREWRKMGEVVSQMALLRVHYEEMTEFLKLYNT